MKKILFFLFITLFIIPYKTYAFSSSAHSITVIDTDTKRILYQKNGDEKNLIASITKIMTI